MSDSPIQKAQRKYQELSQKGKIPSMLAKFKQHPTALKAIRLFCIDCQGGSRKAPALCMDKSCHLFQFRMGHNPRKPTLNEK